MSNVFTLLNNSNTIDLSKMREQINSVHTKTDPIVLHNIMIKALFGTVKHGLITIGDITLICDGHIYNYKNIYDDLHITPQTDYDFEVIIHLYIKYGIETTLQLLDGVFAFALIDYRISPKNDLDAKMYIARDPYGVKPLYILQLNKEHPQFSQFSAKGENIISCSSDEQTLLDIGDIIKNNAEMNSVRSSLSDSHRTGVKAPIFVVEAVAPGTYTWIDMKFKVFSSWEILRYQIPYHSYTPGTWGESKDADERVLSHIEEAYLKRYVYFNKKTVIVVNSEQCPLEGLLALKVSGIHKMNKSIIYMNHCNDPDALDEWRTVARDIAEKHPGYVVFLNVGIDSLIKELGTMSALDFRFLCQNYFKRLMTVEDPSTYSEAERRNMKMLVKIFREEGVEIDFPLLDIQFIQHFLTHPVSITSFVVDP